MADKEIRELEIRVNTVGAEQAEQKISKLNDEFNRIKRETMRVPRKKGTSLPRIDKQKFDIQKAISKKSIVNKAKDKFMGEYIDKQQKMFNDLAGVRQPSGMKDLTYRHWWQDTLNERDRLKKENDEARRKIVRQRDREARQRREEAERQTKRAARVKQAEEQKLLKEWVKAKEAHQREQIQNEIKARKQAEYKRYEKGKMQTEAAKSVGKTSMKKYKRRISDEVATYHKSRKTLSDFPIVFKNSIGSIGQTVTQAIGELTMFAGAITMVGFMAKGAFQNLMALGDKFASTESKFMVGAAYREQMFRERGHRGLFEFDKASAFHSDLTGENKFTAAQTMARVANQIKGMGGSVNQSALTNASIAAVGTSAITGDTVEKMMAKVMDVAKKGKDADKIGLGQLKLTKNMNENLALIAKATKENPIAKTAIDQGTISIAMTRTREAFDSLFGNVFGRHTKQTRDAFGKMGKNFQDAFNDPEVIKAWSKTLTNLTEMMDSVLTKDNIKKAAIGAAQWGAEIITMGGNFLKGAMWFLNNSDTVLSAISAFAKVWAAINAIKLGVGMWKLYADIKNAYLAYVAIKGISGAGLAAATGATTAASTGAGLGMAGLFGAGGLGAAITAGIASNPIGWTVGLALGATALTYAGYQAYKNWNKDENTQDALNNAIDINSPIFSPTGSYLKDPVLAPAMPAWSNPNAKVIYVSGDVNLDASQLSVTEEAMIQGAGTI